MTSQEEVTTDEVADVLSGLKAQAKELGVTGWQACKDPEKLIAKIEEAKTMAISQEETRKTAPKMGVFNAGQNSRNQVIARLEKEDPACKYMTQRAGITPEELAAKGLEVVKKPNGEIIYHGADIVCRTEKESYYKWQQSRNDFALEGMKSIDKDLSTDGGGRKIQALTEHAKQGINPK
jgi:hypothetical protein